MGLGTLRRRHQLSPKVISFVADAVPPPAAETVAEPTPVAVKEPAKKQVKTEG